MLFGQDFLGGAKYQSKVLKHGTGAVGVFMNTFGDALPLIKALVARGQCKAIRAQGVWSDTHSFGSKEEALAIREAKRLEPIARSANIPIYYSPYCEHKKKASEMLKLMNKIKAVAPSLFLVNCPIRGGQYLDGFINEVHHDDNPGTPPGQYIFSFDGKHCVDADVEAYKKKHANAIMFFMWVLQYNGKKNSKDTTPRPQRKAWPSERLIESVQYLYTDKGVTNLDNKYLYKSHAEQHTDQGEPRANKPVIILPNRPKKLELVTGDGRVLAKTTESVKYQSGGWLYRFTDWGYRYAKTAHLCFLRADNKNIGVVNPGFREGTKR